MKLWNHEHTGCPHMVPTREIGSWAEFAEEFGDTDVHDNFIWRWDWLVTTRPADGEIAYISPPIVRPGMQRYHHELWLQMAQQRRGTFTEFLVRVTTKDEPKVRDYLERHASMMRELWEPLLPEPPEPVWSSSE